MATVSLTPAQVQWTIYEGATFKQLITVLSSGLGSTPINLTGYHGALNIRNLPTQDILLTLTDTNGGLTFGGAAGTIQIYIPNTTTATLRWRTAVFDLLITEPGGDVDAILAGKFTVQGIIY